MPTSDYAARRFLRDRPDASALFALAVTPRLEIVADGDVPEILLYDEIGSWGITARDFVGVLAQVGSGPCRLRINSPGGDVFDSMAIYNAVRQRGAVEVVIDGLAASGASVVAMAGASVVMHDAAMMMIHRAWTVTMGDAPEHNAAAATLEKVDGQMAAIYGGRSGQTADEMLAAMTATTWYTAAEAVAAHLADGTVPASVAPTPASPPPAATAETALANRRRRLALAERA